MFSSKGLAVGYFLLKSVLQVSAAGNFSGDFNITRFRLYPENLDYDTRHNKLYLGANFNASVSVYDPVTTELQILTFDGISGVDPYHISGVDYDALTGFIYFSANSASPFITFGGNLSGPNQLIKYDTNTQQTVWIKSLEGFQAEALNQTGHVISGFQDIEEDDQGNAYFLASYGPGIAKFSPDGDVSVFFAPSGTNDSTSTFGGLIWTNNKLILHDDVEQSLVYILTNVTDGAAEAVKILTSNLPTVNSTITCDGVYAPPKYNDSVLLCSDDGINAIRVFQSTDSWDTAEYLGEIDNPITNGGPLPTATVQIDEAVYISESYFFDGEEFDTAGNRTIFPFPDITSDLAALVEK